MEKLLPGQYDRRDTLPAVCFFTGRKASKREGARLLGNCATMALPSRSRIARGQSQIFGVSSRSGMFDRWHQWWTQTFRASGTGIRHHGGGSSRLVRMER